MDERRRSRSPAAGLPCSVLGLSSSYFLLSLRPGFLAPMLGSGAWEDCGAGSLDLFIFSSLFLFSSNFSPPENGVSLEWGEGEAAREQVRGRVWGVRRNTGL